MINYEFSVWRGHAWPSGKMSQLLRIMKLTSLLLLWASLHLAAATKSQTVTLKVKKQPLPEVLASIKAQTGYLILYNDRYVNPQMLVSIDVNNQRLETVLDQLLSPRQLTYYIKDQTIAIRRPKTTSAQITRPMPVPEVQQPEVSGTVTDESGQPLEGVTVAVKNSRVATITDSNGNYRIPISKDGTTLVFTIVGFDAQEHRMGTRRVFDLRLKASLSDLDEVVVVGYGTTRKSDLTGSIASVKSEDLNIGMVQSADIGLRGKVAGVQVTQISGQPGAGTTIRIRGTNSIQGNNEPLYVVDGIPLSGGNNAEGLATGIDASTSGLTHISPSDIESIEILKDASATAIYGARGASGVVLITTKRGKEGASNVNFNVYTGMQQLDKKVELTSPEEWAIMWNEAAEYLNLPTRYDVNNLPARTDWQNEIYRKAPIQNYELMFSGGNEKMRYMLSSGYMDQKGIVVNSSFKRYSFRLNLDRKVSDRLNIGANFSVVGTNSNVAESANENATDAVGATLLASPTLSVKENGEYILYVDMDNKNPNPVSKLREYVNKDIRSRLLGNIFGELDIIPGLKAKVSFSMDVSNGKANFYAPKSTTVGKLNEGLARVGVVNTVYWNSTNTLTYTKEINDIHRLTVMGGVTWEKSVGESLSSTASGFVTDLLTFNNLGSATNLSTASGNPNMFSIHSYIGRANYSLLDRYLLTFTGRIDGSSRFGAENKYAVFPSLALGWRLSEEPFFQPLKATVNNLKLRVSHGVTGEQAIPSFRSLSSLTSSVIILGEDANAVGFYQTRLPNPNLKWERTRQTDLGIDVGFWNNRLSLVVDVYKKKTTDLLFAIDIPRTSGFQSALQNIGSIENKGLEVGVSAQLLSGKFSWDMTINNSFNRNKLLALSSGIQEIYNPTGGIISGDTKSQPTLLRVGMPLGILYGYVFDGAILDEAEAATIKQSRSAPGELKVKDIDGDGAITVADKTIIGNANPKYTGGWTNNFSYKGFGLMVLTHWSVGNDIYSLQHVMNTFMDRGYNMAKDFYLNRWTAENPNSHTPRSGHDARNYVDNSWHVFNGSFFRIKNITLSYDIPVNTLDIKFLRGLRAYLSADNVHTFTKYPGYNPEGSAFGSNSLAQGVDIGVYPNAKVFMLGLNVTF